MSYWSALPDDVRKSRTEKNYAVYRKRRFSKRRIELKSGAVLEGIILTADAGSILLKTDKAEHKILRRDILVSKGIE